MAHVWAVFTLLPPEQVVSAEPIYGADHPAHAYRVHFYRSAVQQGDWPWGYDPAVSAGALNRPAQDAGAKPQQVLGLLLPFLSPGQVVRLFLFGVAFTFPLWPLWAARIVGMPISSLPWLAVVLIGPAWLYQNFAGFFLWGLASFACASYFSPLVLALFLRFLAHPSRGTYLAAVAALGLLTFIHVLGPVLIAPVMLIQTVFARPLPMRWRLAALLAPVAVFAANACWLVPFGLDVFFTPTPPARTSVAPTPDLVYQSWQDLWKALSPERVTAALTGLLVSAYGFRRMHRLLGLRVASAFAAAALLGLLLKFGGSFVPLVDRTQPSRFMLGAFVMLTFPVALALHELARKVRLPNVAAVLPGLILLAAASWMSEKSPLFSTEDAGEYRNYAGMTRRDHKSFLALPGQVPLYHRKIDPLTRFVREHTTLSDRLLVQTRIQCEPRVLALVWGREVVGNTYPDFNDPANFLYDRLWGRGIKDWTPDQIRDALRRWGITWIITSNEEATRLLEKVCGQGHAIGIYRAFRFQPPASRFLIGSGVITSGVNRFELDNLTPTSGMVVLRYRYHPAWETEEGIPVLRYPIPEDPAGFIALQDPPKTVRLRFNTTRYFVAEWSAPVPEVGQAPRSSTQ